MKITHNSAKKTKSHSKLAWVPKIILNKHILCHFTLYNHIRHFVKKIFPDFLVIFVILTIFSLIYTGTKKKPYLLTILQKTLGKNFCKSIIFSKPSQTSKFFFERLTYPLDFFSIKYHHRHTPCRHSRSNIPKKAPFVNNVQMTLEMLL